MSPAYGALVNVGGSIIVYSNAALNPYSHLTNGGSVRFAAANLTVAQGGSFSADSIGFGQGPTAASRGYGPGGGFVGTVSAGGGGYGGTGGTGQKTGDNGGGTYGSSNAPPIHAGSGGGSGNNGGAGCGSRGGGVVWCDVTGTIALYGTISATSVVANGYGGGGAGGGIYLTCRTLTGAAPGALNVTGGKGGSESGGGGGGRIMIWRRNDTSTGLTISTNGGAQGASAGATPSTPGTAFFGWIIPPKGTIMVIR